MIGNNNKLLLASIVAGIFLLMGCGPAVEEVDEEESTATSGITNLSVDISSPAWKHLYGDDSPELRYTITEGADNTDVPTSRLGASVFNTDEQGERFGSALIAEDVSSGAELPAVEDGGHELQLIINDEAGDPQVTLIIPYATDITSAEINVVSFITNDATPILQYTIDDSCFTDTPATCDETVEIFDSNGVAIVSKEDNLKNGDAMPPLGDGQYTLEISYTDLVGNITTVQTTFTIDTTSNSIQITAIITNDPTPILFYSIDEECFTDDDPDTTCNETVTLEGQEIDTRNGQPLPALDDSTPINPDYTVEITYIDTVGNVSRESLTFIIDATPPEVDVIDPVAPPPGPDPAPDRTDTEITPGGDTLVITGSLGEGTVTFTSSEIGAAAVALTDAAGVTSIVDPPTGAILVAGRPGWFEVVEGTNYTVAVSSLAVGTHKVEVFVVDDLGNQADEPLTFEFTVQDAGQPTATIVSPSDGALLHPVTPTSSTYDVTYKFSVSDAVNQPQEITVSVTLEQWQSDPNGGSWVAASSLIGGLDETMLTIAGQEGIYEKSVAMPDGKYRLAFTATDTALNTTTTPTREFSVDTTPPNVEIRNPVDGSVQTTGSPILEFWSNEQSEFAVAVQLCVLLAGSWECWTSSTTADGKLKDVKGNPLPNGEYRVSVTLTDAAGFTGSDEVGFTVNAGPSNLEILSPLSSDPPITGGKTHVRIRESGFTHATLTVYFNGQQEGQPVEKLVGTPEPNVEVFNNVPLPHNGTYTLTVVASDDTLVNPTASASVTVTTDLSLPVVKISSPTADDTNRHFMKTEPVPFTYSIHANTPYSVSEIRAWIGADEPGNQIALPGLSGTVMLDFSGIPGVRATRTITLWAQNDNGGTSQISRTLFIDSAIPVVSNLLPTNGSETTENPLLSYVVKDSVTNSTEATRNETVWLNGDPISQRSGNSLGSLNLVPDATYTITVQVEDLAGNLSDKLAPSASTTFEIEEEDADGDDHHQHGHHHKHHKHHGHHHHKRGHNSSCFWEAVKGDENVLRELVKCVTHHAKEHHKK